MIPYLYKQQYLGTGSEFRIGSLPSWIECKVTEELNGEFYLEGTLPVGGKNVDELMVDRIIMCAPAPPRPPSGISGDPFSYRDVQPFRIRSIKKPPDSDVVQVTAFHVSYQLTENFVEPASFNYASVQTLFNALLNSSGTLTDYVVPSIGLFHFVSDITLANAKQVTHETPVSVRNFLGGDGGVQSLFGGFFDWNGWEVYLRSEYGLSPRGRPTDIVIAYSKNMESLEFETTVEGLVTGYYGYYKKDYDYVCAVCYVSNSTDYPYQRIEVVDLTNQFESAPTEQALLAALEDYRDEQQPSGAQIPTSITVTAVPDVLQNVFLCDQVTVLHPDYNIKNVSRVVKTVYDPIRERYDAITIGQVQTGITDTIAKMINVTKNVASGLNGG